MDAHRWAGLTAADIMKAEIISVVPAATMREVAGKLQKHGVSGVCVREGKGPIQGILSWRDVVDHLGESLITCGGDESVHDYFRATDTMWCDVDDGEFDDTIKARDVMNRDLLTIPDAAPLREIAAKMSEYRVHRLLVTDASDAIVGIISTLDVMDALSA